MVGYLKCKIQHNNYNKTNAEDKIILPFLPDGLNNNLFILNNEFEVKLNGHMYQKNLIYLENEVLFNRTRKYWKGIENLILTGSTTINCATMKEVINLLSITYQNLEKSTDQEMQASVIKCVDLFKKTVQKIRDIDEAVLMKLTSNIITLEEEPLSHYFHSYFAVFYLILSIEKICSIENFQGTCESVILDLAKLSEVIYDKNKDDILLIQPFVCMCVKNLWLFLMENVKSTNFSFWVIFNKCIGKCDKEFCIWLMKHLSLVLQSNLNENCDVMKGEYMNIDLVNKVLQSLTSQPYNESKFFNILKLLNPILTDLWIEHMRLDPYQILCDFFYKNINNPIQNTLTSLPKTVNEFRANIDCILSNPDGTKSPYEYFLYLLHKHLSKHPLHWKKLQGRIYSRLPEQKVQEFNDNAIYNVALLFFTLASLKIQEMLEKLSTILGCLPSNRENTEFVWILHIYMVNVSAQQNRDISKVAKTLQTLVKNSSENREHFHLMKHYLKGLTIIFNTSDDFNVNQNCLLGSWIAPFMSSCCHSDLRTLLQLLIDILKKAGSLGKWTTFKPIYQDDVLPTLKQISLTSSCAQIGELVGLIVLNIPELQITLIQYFCKETVNVNITKEFVLTVLSDWHVLNAIAQHENVLISAWCRICLLCSDTINTELCKRIFNLQSIRSMVVVEHCDEPFIDFVKALNKQMAVQSQIFRLKELCVSCFGNIDRWISSYLTPSTEESQILYLYTKISMLFYYCAPLLYQKSKSNCLLNRLVTTLLLPTEILTGKPPSTNILHAIEKTWHLFVKGIYKLDHTSDPYIDRTLKDLIIRFVPHFPTVNSPMTNILDHSDITNYVLEKITNSFLLRSARSSEENTFKALKILNNILEISIDLPRIQSIIQKVLPGIFEVLMFNIQKSAALEIIKLITFSEWYNHVRQNIQSSIKNVTSKHLAFNTNNYFQLITILRNYMPEDIKSVLPHIKDEISHVERMRGVGFDNKLREALNKIESLLEQNVNVSF